MAERSHTHVYSRSALTVWRAVPLCCNAMLAQRMRAQRASHTAARAEYHTLACPRSSARPSNHHIWSDIGLATQTTKTVVRGARGTCLQTTCEGRFQCVLGTTHRDRHHATGVVALARVSSPSRRNYEITASSKLSTTRRWAIVVPAHTRLGRSRGPGGVRPKGRALARDPCDSGVGALASAVSSLSLTSASIEVG